MTRRGYGGSRRRGMVHPRGVFTDRAHADLDDVAQVMRIVDRADVADWIAQWRAEDRADQGRGPGGRPSTLDDRQVLILLLLLGLVNQPLTVRAMTSLVMWGLDKKSLEALGIDLADLLPEDLYHRIWRSLHRTLRVLDPLPISKYRRLSTAELQRALAPITPEFEDCRKDRLTRLSNRLVWSSTMELPRDIRRRWKGNTAVDGTAIAAYSRKPTRDWAAVDPSAGPYKLRGTHGLSDADVASLSKKIKGKLGDFLWAWEATLLVAATNDPDREQTFPQLAVGMVMDKPAVSPGRNAIAALRQMRANGMPAGHLVGDRAYGYAPLVENYSGPALELGYSVAFDLNRNELGKVRRVDGMVLLEGNLYCPTIINHPKLVWATRDLRFGDPEAGGATISWEEYDKRIEQRARFLVQANGRPRPDGSRRVACPAAGPRPTVACPLREPRDPNKVVGLWPVRRADLPSEDVRGGVCTNAGGNVTVQADDLVPRYVQDVQFGSREWRSIFQPLRQTIESVNAQLKNGSKSVAGSPERRRVRGLAAACLFMASLLVGLNLRKIAVFLAGPVPQVDDRGRGRVRGRSRRRADSTYRWGSRLYRNAPPSGAPPGVVA